MQMQDERRKRLQFKVGPATTRTGIGTGDRVRIAGPAGSSVLLLSILYAYYLNPVTRKYILYIPKYA